MDGSHDKLLDALVAQQRAIFEDELERLAEDGPIPTVAPPGLPAPFLTLLVRSLRLAAHEGDTTRASLLRHYHLDILQRRRVVVLAGRAEPRAHSLLSTPLELSRCPHFAAAVSRLEASLATVAPSYAGLSQTLDGKTFAEIFADCFYGRYAPPLGTSDQELAAIMDEAEAGVGLHEVFDRRLAGPLLHELTHLGSARSPLSPPYLDECIAAALGARAMPALICPDEADHRAMVGAAWFVQVGEHLFLAFGFEPIVAAHAGVRPWSEVLPDGLVDLFAELGWQQYLVSRHVAFLGEAQSPDPWVKLIHLARSDRLALLDDARLAGGVALFEALRDLEWDTIAARPIDGSSMRPAFECAMMARPRLGPRGEWRVGREPLTAHYDPASRAWVSPRDASSLEPRWVVGPVEGLALPRPLAPL